MFKKCFHSLRKIIKKYYKECRYVRFILEPLLGIYNFIIFYFLSDEEFSKWMFKAKMGFKPDLITPVTLNEKDPVVKVA